MHMESYILQKYMQDHLLDDLDGLLKRYADSAGMKRLAENEATDTKRPSFKTKLAECGCIRGYDFFTPQPYNTVEILSITAEDHRPRGEPWSLSVSLYLAGMNKHGNAYDPKIMEAVMLNGHGDTHTGKHNSFVNNYGGLFLAMCRETEALSPLLLPIKSEWLSMIKTGAKPEEYREIKPYWEKRILKWMGYPPKENLAALLTKHPEEQNTARPIILRNGYDKHADTLIAMATLRVGKGTKGWGAVPGTEYYVFKIQDTLPLGHVAFL